MGLNIVYSTPRVVVTRGTGRTGTCLVKVALEIRRLHISEQGADFRAFPLKNLRSDFVMTGGEDDPMVHLIDKYVNILTLESEKKTGDDEEKDDELEIPKTLGDLVKALLRLQRNIRREVKEGIRPFETLATHGVGAVLAGISDVAENRPQTNQSTPRRHFHHQHHHTSISKTNNNSEAAIDFEEETKNGLDGDKRSSKKRASAEVEKEEKVIEVAVKEENKNKQKETVHHDSVFVSAAKEIENGWNWSRLGVCENAQVTNFHGTSIMVIMNNNRSNKCL